MKIKFSLHYRWCCWKGFILCSKPSAFIFTHKSSAKIDFFMTIKRTWNIIVNDNNFAERENSRIFPYTHRQLEFQNVKLNYIFHSNLIFQNSNSLSPHMKNFLFQNFSTVAIFPAIFIIACSVVDFIPNALVDMM
jgi:hypothetical protein